MAAFCGIGNPAAFRRTLEGLGATVVDFRRSRDHHAYTREDVEDLARWADTLPADAMIATTQKDWVKLRLARTRRPAAAGGADRPGVPATGRTPVR